MLAKEIISLVCSHETPIETCCCESAVLYLWTRQLPTQVKARIAGKSLKGGDNLKETLKLADAVYDSTVKSQPAQVAATTTDSPDPSVAALARGRGRGGNSRGRGRGRGQRGNQPTYGQSRQNGPTQQQSQSQNWGPKHQDNPPDNSCRAHWKWGNSAYFCSDRANCPWKDRITPRPPQTQNQP